MATEIPRGRRQCLPVAALAVLAIVFTTACGSGNSGFPKEPGQYTIQPGSLTYDGKKYALLWSDPGGGLHKAEGQDVRMQRGETTFLEIGSGGGPVVNVKEDEAVTVRGRDSQGEFSTPWLPFFLGYAMGGLGGGPVINQPYPGDAAGRGAGYQYPPSDSFGRGDQLNGSVQRSKAEPPDYSKVQPAPYSVSGQSAGTGGGSAATNKSAAPLTGQSGGTGSGSAASGKGTFAQSGKAGGGPGINGGSGWTAPSRPSTGTGVSSGGGARPGFSVGGRRR